MTTYWYKYLILFGFGTFKFLFAPFVGVAMKLKFLETYIPVVLGAIVASAISYYISKSVFVKLRNLKIKKQQKSPDKPMKKKFTWVNRMIIKIKWRFGILGICLLAPLFLSIPIGTVIATKFYHKDNRTLILILLGIVFNGFLLTSIAYIKHILKL